MPEGYYPKHGGFGMGGGMYPGFGTGTGLGLGKLGAAGVSAPREKSERGEDKDKTSNPNSASGINSAGGLAKDLIWWVPDKKLRSGVKEYVSIVNPDAYSDDQSVGGSNAGINGHFSKAWDENSCLQAKAVDFYKEVDTYLRKNPACGADDKTSTEAFPKCSKRPTVSERVGVGDKSYLKEGWLLSLAMRHANNNPIAAMQLIGLCGTDDTARNIYNYMDATPESKMEIDRGLKAIKEQKSLIDEQLKAALASFDSDKQTVYSLSNQSQFYDSQIQHQENLTVLRREMKCPPKESDFFLAGSLGPHADISKELKAKIQKIQDPESKKRLASKNYHIWGAAYMGCRMSAKGVKSKDAKLIEQQASHMYRAVRMCNASRTKLQLFDHAEKYVKRSGFDINKDTKTIKANVVKYLREGETAKIQCPTLPEFGVSAKFIEDYFEVFLRDSGLPRKEAEARFGKCVVISALKTDYLRPSDPKELAAIEKKVEAGLVDRDTAYLFRVWYLGGEEFFGNDVACTGIRNGGPRDLMKSDDWIAMTKKPWGWDDDRFHKASKSLATWEVDFEWTMAQHEIGAEFGAKLCMNNKKSNPFEQPWCNAAKNPFAYKGPNKFVEPAGDSRESRGSR